MHYFDNYRLLKQCYFDEKYSEFIRFALRARSRLHCAREVDTKRLFRYTLFLKVDTHDIFTSSCFTKVDIFQLFSGISFSKVDTSL